MINKSRIFSFESLQEAFFTSEVAILQAKTFIPFSLLSQNVVSKMLKMHFVCLQGKDERRGQEAKKETI